MIGLALEEVGTLNNAINNARSIEYSILEINAIETQIANADANIDALLWEQADRVARCRGDTTRVGPLVLPMAETADAVLDMVQGEVLGTRMINELLALVDRGETDDSARLAADRDRLRGEVDRLVASIAAGVPARRSPRRSEHGKRRSHVWMRRYVHHVRLHRISKSSVPLWNSERHSGKLICAPRKRWRGCYCGGSWDR